MERPALRGVKAIRVADRARQAEPGSLRFAPRTGWPALRAWLARGLCGGGWSIIVLMAGDVPRGKVRLRFTDYVVDPRDPDIMRRTMDVEADVITFDGQSVCLWLRGVEVQSVPSSSLASIELAQENPTTSPKAYSVQDVRTRHANAYQRWTPEDEQLLVKLHTDGHDPESLARRFHRQPSAIRARLEKLGMEKTRPSGNQASTPPF